MKYSQFCTDIQNFFFFGRNIILYKELEFVNLHILIDLVVLKFMNIKIFADATGN